MLVRLLDQHPSLAGSIRAVTFKANLSVQDQKDVLSRTTSLDSAFGVSVSGVLQVLVEDGRSLGLRHLGVTSLKGTKLQFKLSLQHFAALESLSLDVESRFCALDDPDDPEIQLGELTKLTLDSCPSSVIDILRRARSVKIINWIYNAEVNLVCPTSQSWTFTLWRALQVVSTA